jgi:hypothetical protein
MRELNISDLDESLVHELTQLVLGLEEYMPESKSSSIETVSV